MNGFKSFSTKEDAKKLLEKKNELLLMLKNCEKYYQNSRYYYNLISSTSKFAPETNSNRINIENGQKVIIHNRNNLSQLIKSLESQYGRI